MVRVVMREVDQSTLLVPDVFTMHDHRVAGHERHPLADIDVVLDEQRLRRSLDLKDESLMRPRWPGVVREEPRDGAFGGDLDLRAMFGKRAVDRRVSGGDRAAGRA